MKLRLLHFCAFILFISGSVMAQGDSNSMLKPVVSAASLDLITVPDGYISSEQFNGYVKKGAATNIVMTSINNVNPEDMDSVWKQDESRKLLNRSQLTSEKGYEIYLYKESLISGESEVILYTVFIGNLNSTIWLSISHPAQLDSILEKELIEIIESTDLNPIK